MLKNGQEPETQQYSIFLRLNKKKRSLAESGGYTEFYFLFFKVIFVHLMDDYSQSNEKCSLAAQRLNKVKQPFKNKKRKKNSNFKLENNKKIKQFGTVVHMKNNRRD